MRMRKIITGVLSITMVLSLITGCGAGSSDMSSAKVTTESNDSQKAEDTTDTNKTTNGGKALVVYFSATGSTKAVAETIADTTGGDLFEIQPEDPYTDEDLNWSDDNSRVTKEHEDESLRDVALTTTKVENWDSYDTIFIGYPIWWGIAAWPVDNFVKENDFSRKTVIPFCTSASSGIGDSGQLLEKMAGSGNWQDGERFSSGASESEVADWVKSVGF